MCSSVLNTNGGSISNEANSPRSPTILAASRNDSASRSIASSSVCSRRSPPGHMPTQSQPTCLAKSARSRNVCDPLLAHVGVRVERFGHSQLDGKHLQAEPVVHAFQRLDPLRLAGRRVVPHRPAFDQFDAVEALPAGEIQDLPDRIDPVVVLARRHESVESDGRLPAVPWATPPSRRAGSTTAAAAPPIHCNMVRRFIRVSNALVRHARSTSCSTSTGRSARTGSRH